MNKSTEFYLERAAEAAEEAEKTALDNVRDRALRSEAAWLKLANKTSDVERERAAREAATAAMRAVTAEAAEAASMQAKTS